MSDQNTDEREFDDLPDMPICIDDEVFDLSEYSQSYRDWVTRDADCATDVDLAAEIEERGMTPQEAPIIVFDLDVLGGGFAMPGRELGDRQGIAAGELLGFSTDAHVDVMADDSIEWSDPQPKHYALTNKRGRERFAWCLRECRGPWFLYAGTYDDREGIYPLFAVLMRLDDQTRFNALFPDDVRPSFNKGGRS
jgi:hypothetical protein